MDATRTSCTRTRNFWQNHRQKWHTKLGKRHREILPAKLDPKRAQNFVSVTFMINTREHISVLMVRVLLYFLPFTYELLIQVYLRSISGTRMRRKFGWVADERIMAKHFIILRTRRTATDLIILSSLPYWCVFRLLVIHLCSCL